MFFLTCLPWWLLDNIYMVKLRKCKIFLFFQDIHKVQGKFIFSSICEVINNQYINSSNVLFFLPKGVLLWHIDRFNPPIFSLGKCFGNFSKGYFLATEDLTKNSWMYTSSQTVQPFQWYMTIRILEWFKGGPKICIIFSLNKDM